MNTKVMLNCSIMVVVLVFSTLTFNAQDTTQSSLSIPSIGVNTSIDHAPFSNQLRTWDVSQLFMTVGHLEYTPWFGSGSNVVIGGHSTTRDGSPDIFYHLDDVKVGDEIVVQDNNVTHRYIVTRTFTVEASDISILDSTSTEMLTLFTCDVSSYNEATSRFNRRDVVVGEKIP